MPHYAEAFSTIPGQCFRFVSSTVPEAQGMPHHCPQPVALRGTFIDPMGKPHRVSASMEHGDAVEDGRDRIYPVNVRQIEEGR